MINEYRHLSDIQKKFLPIYLEKSGDTLDDFLQTDERIEVKEFNDLGWIEIAKYDNILWIHSAYSCKPHKETIKIWDWIKDIAKKVDCDRIQFTTKRNPKAFKRLFNADVIDYKMEVLL